MSAAAGFCPGLFVSDPGGGSGPSPIPPGVATDIYLSAANGNDAFDGLTPATAKATLEGAYAVATFLAAFQLPHGLCVIHVGAGTYNWAPMPFPLTILGDGAGQPGDDGFTVVTTGVSAAGTNATSLTLAAPVAVNLYRNLTLEWRSGAAAGHRLLIQRNATTVVFPVEVAGYPSGSIDPGVGSDFAILTPAVIFLTTAIEVDGIASICDGLGASSREYYPAALVNVRMVGAAATSIMLVSASRLRLFGVQFVGILYLIDAQIDAGFVLPDGAMDAWALRVGLAGGAADIPLWIGWGISWPLAVAATNSFALTTTSALRGFFAVGTLNPSMFEAGQDLTATGTIEVDGGGCLGELFFYGGRWIQGNFNVPFVCRRALFSLASDVQISNLLCDAASTGAPITIEWDTIVNVLGPLIAQGSNGTGIIVRNMAKMFVRSFSAFTTSGPGGAGLLVDQGSEVQINNVSTATLTGAQQPGLIVRNQSRFNSEAAGPLTITSTSATQPAIDVLGGSDCMIQVTCALNAQGGSGGARVRSNSRLTIERVAFTAAATTAGSGIECNGGSSCYLTGGAGNVCTGLGGAGFGVNCRGGGEAYFLAAPPATVTGPAGDLTVGTGGGETVAVAALAASLSFVTSGPSAIARAS